jgi:hypothetical protein
VWWTLQVAVPHSRSVFLNVFLQNVTLAANVTLPAGGYMCIPIEIPELSFQVDALGVLYFQSTSPTGGNVSSCVNIALDPDFRIQSYPVQDSGVNVTDSQGVVSYERFYCGSNNGTAPPVTTLCACHWCDASCT